MENENQLNIPQEMPLQRICVIVSRQVLMAQDIAGAITDHDPAAKVIICRTIAESMAALDTVDAISIAFVSESPMAFAGCDLAKRIAGNGGRVVLMGDAAEDDPAGWDVLRRPFTSAAVVAHLAR